MEYNFTFKLFCKIRNRKYRRILILVCPCCAFIMSYQLRFSKSAKFSLEF